MGHEHGASARDPPGSIATMERKMTADVNMEVRETAREVITRAATTAKERAADARDSVEHVTAAIENAAGGSVRDRQDRPRHPECGLRRGRCPVGWRRASG